MRLDASVHYPITRLVFTLYFAIITACNDFNITGNEKSLMGSC